VQLRQACPLSRRLKATRLHLMGCRGHLKAPAALTDVVYPKKWKTQLMHAQASLENAH
jgi:hypothetical protein